MAYSHMFQPSWRFGQPRQRSSLPANSTQPDSPPGEVVPFDAALTQQLARILHDASASAGAEALFLSG